MSTSSIRRLYQDERIIRAIRELPLERAVSITDARFGLLEFAPQEIRDIIAEKQAHRVEYNAAIMREVAGHSHVRKSSDDMQREAVQEFGQFAIPSEIIALIVSRQKLEAFEEARDDAVNEAMRKYGIDTGIAFNEAFMMREIRRRTRGAYIGHTLYISRNEQRHTNGPYRAIPYPVYIRMSRDDLRKYLVDGSIPEDAMNRTGRVYRRM